MRQPDDLGRDYRRALDGFPGDDRLRSQRTTFTESLERPRRSRRLLWALSGAAAVVVAVVVTSFLLRDDMAIFRVGDTPGEVGRLIVADTGVVLPITFASATVGLEPGTEATVVYATPERSRVRLHAGRVRARVDPQKRADWSFDAGPYTVGVVGTELSVAWDPDASEAVVEVTRGRVQVTGGHLSAKGVNLSAGERLHLDARAGTDLLVGTTPEPPSPAPEREPTVHKRPNLDWRALARRGDHRKALAAAKRAGFERLTRTLGAEGLVELADVARFARDPVSAEVALEALVSRFPRSQPGKDATFLLGRLILDRDGPAEQATIWLRRYLRVAPDGHYSEEARGRLIVALRGSQRWEAARQAANDYLARYPRGSYASLARLTLDRETP